MTPEKEVERLLKRFLPGTPQEGLAKAVGGYVRDEYLASLEGMPHDPKDLDIVVGYENGSEELSRSLHQKFPHSIYEPRRMGANYPIWQLVFHEDIIFGGEVFSTTGATIEFADSMQESYPDPSSRQRVTVPGTLAQDVLRRDFTVNMLMKDMTTGELEDRTGVSLSDVAAGVLRAHPLVNPDTMFEEDPLRMLRLIRFQAKYGWRVPLSMIRSVRRNAYRLDIVSKERVCEELRKILSYGKLYQAVKLMSASGLLKVVFPHVEKLKGCTQDSRHHAEGDVYKHTLMVLKEADASESGQLAALLHDISKPHTREVFGDRIKFLRHEYKGEALTRDILTKLKFPTEVVDKVASMVGLHMRPHFLDHMASEKHIRRFLRSAGPLLDDVMALADADRKGAIPYRNDIDLLNERILKVQENDRNLGVDSNKPILDGHEVMEILGISKGPYVGEAKTMLRDLLDDSLIAGEVLTKESAAESLKAWYKTQTEGITCPMITTRGHLHRNAKALVPQFQRFLDRLPIPKGVVSITVEAPYPLPSGLYGPLAGDPPIDESQVTYTRRPGRKWPSRTIQAPMRDSLQLTFTYGPMGATKDHPAHPKALYTVFPGPFAEREVADRYFKQNSQDVEALTRSIEFWRDHAITPDSF